MPNKLWTGEDRKAHDDNCEVKWRERYREIGKDICLATKPGKARQAMMWTIMTIMLAASLSAAFKTISSAGTQASIDTAQNLNIEHNEERLEVITKAHESLVKNTEKTAEEVRKIRETQIEVQINQTNMIKMLERIEAQVQ